MADIKLHTGGLWAKPLATRVFVNGQWVEKVGRVRVGGQWIDFTGDSGGGVPQDKLFAPKWNNFVLSYDDGYLYHIPKGTANTISKYKLDGTPVYTNQPIGVKYEWGAYNVHKGFIYGAFEDGIVSPPTVSVKINATNLLESYRKVSGLAGTMEVYNVTSNDKYSFVHGRDATYMFRNSDGTMLTTPEMPYVLNGKPSTKIITTKATTGAYANSDYEFFGVAHADGLLSVYFQSVNGGSRSWENNAYPLCDDWIAGKSDYWFGVRNNSRQIIRTDLLQGSEVQVGTFVGAYETMTVNDSNQLYVLGREEDYYNPQNNGWYITKVGADGSLLSRQMIILSEMQYVREMVWAEGYLHLFYQKPNSEAVYIKKVFL